MKRLYSQQNSNSKRRMITTQDAEWVISPAFFNDERSKERRSQLKEKGIALSFELNPKLLCRIKVTGTFNQVKSEMILEDFEWAGRSTLEIWTMYNFDCTSMISDSLIVTDQEPGKVVGDCYIYTKRSKVEKSDCPFWYFKETVIKLKIENVKNKKYHLLRSVKTTKLLPVQSLFVYLSTTFNLTIDVLESLFFNCPPRNLSHFSHMLSRHLLWNMY